MLVRGDWIERRVWLWWVASLLAHAALLAGVRRPIELPPQQRFELPSEVQFGLAVSASEAPGGSGAAASSPVEPKPARTRAPVRPRARAVSAVASAPSSVPAQEGTTRAPADAAAISGLGLFEGEGGPGSGGGPGGNGEGGGLAGGTLALTVDLARIRNGALLLETEALLEIIPEWQALFSGSGLSALTDFDRVFVAAPSRRRSSLIVSAEHRLSQERIAGAVSALAAERGAPALFAARAGAAVAPWHNRGPTERVIALPAPGRLLITRTADLERVLAVSSALADARKRQGFSARDVDASGGLLAMQPNEQVGLWVENLPAYACGFGEGLPESARLSIFPVDQFHTELQLSGHYRSAEAATAGVERMEQLRSQLVDHPRVSYLGLRSALEAARIEQSGASVALRVQLTLHQTRYLLRFLAQVLRQPGD